MDGCICEDCAVQAYQVATANGFGPEAKKGVYTVKNYTKLSEMLCLSRATLYRALDALESSGKIKREGKQIILLEEYKQ